MEAYPMSPKTDKEREAKYRAESDLRTLQEAEEVKRDKARMKAALACAKEKMAAMDAVQKANK